MALLDRDGTVIEDRGYLRDPEEVALLPGAVAGLRLLAEHHILPVLVTNQSGIARGLISPLDLSRVNARLEHILSVEGVRLAGVFSCPHSPEDGCGCRKPEPGLAEAAGASLGRLSRGTRSSPETDRPTWTSPAGSGFRRFWC